MLSPLTASRRASSRRNRQSLPRAFRNFERLEDRRLLTSVSTQAALIAAINAANAAGGNNTITVTKNITLFESTPDNATSGPTGLPAITAGDTLTIKGNGHILARNTSSSNSDFRFFAVNSGATLSLNEITLKDGLELNPTSNSIGGAVFVDGGATLNMNSSILTGNSVTNASTTTTLNQAGGAIYNEGATKISNSVLTGNSVTNSAATALTLANLLGGAIFSNGSIDVSHSVVTANAVKFNLTNPPGVGNDQGSNETGNMDGNGNDNGVNGTVLVRGGGIFNEGSLTLKFTTVSNNAATCTITNGSKNPPGGVGNGNNDGESNTGNHDGNDNGNGVLGDVFVYGGGLFNQGGANLEHDAFTGNRAACTVVNGSDNGNNNGDDDTDPAATNNGDDNGNGVAGNVTVAGGALYSNGTFTTTNSSYVANSVACSVTNGNNNGNGNGVVTEDDNGNNNGNGVDGNITLFGGAIANDTGGAATIKHCAVSANSILSAITNGNGNGDGNGENNAGLGNSEGKNNGNAMAGRVFVSGGGIDNEDSTHTDVLSYCFVNANSIKSTVTNGNNDGNMDGNDDGDGDALASVNTDAVLVFQGGGICNDGDLTVVSSIISENSIASTIKNGNNDGNNCGNNNQEDKDGRANGNAVSGFIGMEGGGIVNLDSLDVNGCVLSANFISSSIANGTGDGDNDGQNDAVNNDCGINCGDAVFGDIEIYGGGLGNSGTATIESSEIFGNVLSSTVTNGKNNGQNDGTGSTGTDGQGDGDGLDGTLEMFGGGAANAIGATLTFDSTTVTANSIHSNPSSGSGDTTLDGKVIDGTVSINGINKF